MTLLADVLDPVELTTAVENGHVRIQRHPALPFLIYNYTEACQYAGAWTPVTLACRLHRLVTGLNARTVWEILATGGDLDALTAPLPDEFHAWVRGVADELTATVQARADALEAAFDEIVASMPPGWGRKEFAAAAVHSEHRGLLFLLLDGKDYRPALWHQARPAGDLTATKVAEE